MDVAAIKSDLLVKTKVENGLGNVSAVIAEVCDPLGIRREEVFAAVYGWMLPGALVIMGLLLAEIGSKAIEVTSADVSTPIRVFFSLAFGIACLISGPLYHLYPFNRKRMGEIRL